MKAFTAVTILLAGLALAAGGALAPETAAACDHHPTVHRHHHGHCNWVPGHWEWRWQHGHGGYWTTRRVLVGYESQQVRVPTYREVYDVASDTYVRQADYTTHTQQVPVYRTERVWVNGPRQVRVRVWVPGYWASCGGCCVPVPPPCRHCG